MKTPLLVSIILAAALAACGSASSQEASVDSAKSAQTADPARVTGTWGFVLEASDVAAPIRERCAKESGGDAAKTEACFARVKAEAAKEKIRFATDESGRMVWRSFVIDGGKEELFLEVPVELAADGPTHVLAKIAGPAKGWQAEKLAKSAPEMKALRVEVVDERTIAMTDPKKGRLVYTKE
jgi:hypothetical protein